MVGREGEHEVGSNSDSNDIGNKEKGEMVWQRRRHLAQMLAFYLENEL